MIDETAISGAVPFRSFDHHAALDRAGTGIIDATPAAVARKWKPAESSG